MDLDNLINSTKHNIFILFDYVPTSKVVDNNTKVFYLEGNLNIENSNILKEITSFKSNQPHKILISASNINYNSQNSLLKHLEDLPKHIYLFFCIPSGSLLLPTFTSRCYLLNSGSLEFEKIKKFMGNSIAKRINYIDEIWDNSSSDRNSKILSFINSFELYTHNNITGKNIKKIIELLYSIKKSIRSGLVTKNTIQVLAFV